MDLKIKEIKILAIRTDSPIASLLLLDEIKTIANYEWQADRSLAKEIFAKINQLLAEHDLTIHDLTGIIGYLGPGSFTGLRIGLTTANSLSFGLNIPIVGSSGDKWLDEGLDLLRQNQNKVVLVPEYGSEANITTPKK